METEKRSAWSIVKFVWKELAFALAAILIGVFLAWFARSYGATNAAPLYAGISFFMAAFLAFVAFVKALPFLSNPWEAWKMLRAVNVLAVVVAIVEGVVAERQHDTVVAMIAYGIAAVAVFGIGFLFPLLKPRDQSSEKTE